MAGYDLGSLTMTIGADTLEFESAMNKAQGKVSNLNMSLNQMGSRFMRFGAIMSAYGGVVLLGLKKLAEEAANATGDTDFAATFDSLDEAIEEMKITLGEEAKGTIQDFTKSLTGLITEFNKLDPGIRSGIVNFLLWSSVLAIVLGPLAAFLGTLMKIGAFMGTLNGIIATLTGGAGLGALLVPLALIAAAIIALWIAWQNNWGLIRSHTDSIIQGIRTIFDGFIEFLHGIVDIIDGIINLDLTKVLKGFGEVWGGIFKIVSGLWKIFVDGILGFAFDLVNGVMQWTFKLAAGVERIWAGLAYNVKNIAADIWGGVVSIFQSGATALINFLNGFLTTYNEMMSSIGHSEWRKELMKPVSFGFDVKAAKAGNLAQYNADIAATNAKLNSYMGAFGHSYAETSGAIAQTINIDLSGAFVDTEDRVNDLARKIGAVLASDIKAQTPYGR